ncbi:hypothetical protein Tco_0414576 [Tanacetum coccineum]
MDLKDSLITRNEELNTIPKKESDESIKSSVEDLVPIPSESGDTSRSDSECDLPSCDDFSPIKVYEEKSMTFSNPLFDSNDDFTSIDDESLSDQNIESKASYDSNIDEPALLVTPLFDSNEDECLTPSDEVELLLHRDSSTPMISVVSILEGFIDEPPLEENDDLFNLETKGNEWMKILYDAPIDDLMYEDKIWGDSHSQRGTAVSSSNGWDLSRFDYLLHLPCLHAASIDQSPLCEKSLQEMEDLKQHYLDEMLSLSNDLQIKDYHNEKIYIRFRRECEDMIDELKGKFNGMSIEINKKKELQYLEQVANLSTYPSQHFKSFCYYDDDDDDYEESTIPLNEIDSQTPPSIEITPVLPTLEPEDSLIMGDEELSTTSKKESDEFIKSSVEDLVPIPNESEDTSESDSDCDLLSCDDVSPINVYEEKSVTFSNPLFDSNDDVTSSDDESLSDKDVPKDNMKIYSNPLFEFDDEYISSDVNPLFDKVLEDIECKDSYDSNLDESTFLVTPLSDSNKDECFTPSGDVELLLHHDSSTPMISVVSILEGFTNEPPLEENDNLFDLETKGMTLVMGEDAIFDPGIPVFSLEPVDCLDYEDSHARGDGRNYVVRDFKLVLLCLGDG